MRQRLPAGFVLLVLALAAGRDLLACGDKFLLLGRSLRYEEAYAAKHPASVLIHTGAGRGIATVAGEMVALLKRAGHRPVTADGEAALGEALKSGTFDVVFTDYTDVAAVADVAATAGSKAVVLGVIYKPSDKELEAAEKVYSCVVRAKGKDKSVLAAVNEVTRRRDKGKPVLCGKP